MYIQRAIDMLSTEHVYSGCRRGKTKGGRLDLTNHQLSVSEGVRRDLQVERSRALADAARDVVVGAVARAEPTVVLTGAGDGHATKMCANTKHNQPTQKNAL